MIMTLTLVVLDTLSHYAYLSMKFDKFPLSIFLLWLTHDSRFKPMTFNCDLDFGCVDLNFVHDILSHFALPLYQFD